MSKNLTKKLSKFLNVQKGPQRPLWHKIDVEKLFLD